MCDYKDKFNLVTLPCAVIPSVADPLALFSASVPMQKSRS